MLLKLLYLLAFLYSPLIYYFGPIGLSISLVSFVCIAIYTYSVNRGLTINYNYFSLVFVFFSISSFLYVKNFDQYSFNYFAFLLLWVPVFLVYCSPRIPVNTIISHCRSFFFVLYISSAISLVQLLLRFTFPSSILTLMPWGNGAGGRLFSLFSEPALYSCLNFIGAVLLYHIIFDTSYYYLRVLLFPSRSNKSIISFFLLLLSLGLITASAGFFISLAIFILFSLLLYLINRFSRSMSAPLFTLRPKIKPYLVFVVSAIGAFIIFYLFNSDIFARLNGFLSIELFRLLSFTNFDQILILNRLYSSDLRSLAPLALFFTALQHPLGYAVTTSVSKFVVFFRDESSYFVMALNLWELLFRTFGYFTFILLFILFKKLPFLPFLSLLLVSSIDGALVKPSLPIYFLITYYYTSFRYIYPSASTSRIP